MAEQKYEPELIIGNKNYSSWSMRPWIAMKTFQIPFRETRVRLHFPGNNPQLLDYSPSQKVPVLKHGDLTVWDSLAILEYIAELFPQKALWPKDPGERATARAISCQMHSGFTHLRNECPMNIRREPRAISIGEGTKSDVRLIEALWSNALDNSSGPFLFGKFSIADAMYAPIVNRCMTYKLSTDPAATAYCSTMTQLPAWQEWATDSQDEEWVIDAAEI